MPDQRTLALTLIGAAAVAVAGWLYLESRGSGQNLKAPPAAATPVNPLVAEKRADILYTLPVQQQKTLLKTVEFFSIFLIGPHII